MTADLLVFLRALVFGAAVLAAAAALAAIAVQKRTINPFGRPAQLIRRLTDPLLLPIQRRLLRAFDPDAVFAGGRLYRDEPRAR